MIRSGAEWRTFMQTNTTVSIGELDLPFSASCLMDYHEATVVPVGDRIVVGYLADDHDCENPLESCDGNGKVLSAHRHSDTHSEMQEALALDSCWDRDLDLIDDFIDELRPLWIETAVNNAEFLSWAEYKNSVCALAVNDHVRYLACSMWEYTMSGYIGATDIHHFDFTDEVREKFWEALRSSGRIGNKDAVPLDCYEHSGVAWSISGEGMSCAFDPARGGGVWVPDDSARQEIDRRQAVYTFGRVEANGGWTPSSGKLRFFGVVDNSYGGGKSEGFMHWHEAFDWLQKEVKARASALSLDPGERSAQERQGRVRAATEIARPCVEEYNGWLNGRTFGIVAATFANVGDKDEPEWEFVESDECWGFIGDDYAMEEAESNAKAVAEQMSKQAA
jgi:hypothetical protein